MNPKRIALAAAAAVVLGFVIYLAIVTRGGGQRAADPVHTPTPASDSAHATSDPTAPPPPSVAPRASTATTPPPIVPARPTAAVPGAAVAPRPMPAPTMRPDGRPMPAMGAKTGIVRPPDSAHP